MDRIPENAMVYQIVAVDEAITCACNVLPRNIVSLLLKFGWKSPHTFNDYFDTSLERSRRRPICQERIQRMVGTQCPRLFGRVTNLRERELWVTTTHDSS